MTFEQFKYFLDAYGANLARWPIEQRIAAQAFIVSSSAAAAALAEARRLDAVLDLAAMPRDELGERRLVARLAAQIGRPAQRVAGDFIDRLFSPVWSRAAVVAAMALLGIVTGVIEIEQPAFDAAASDYVQGPSDLGATELAGL